MENNVLEKQMRENLEAIRKMNVEPYKYKYTITHNIQEIVENEEIKNELIQNKTEISIAGRVMSKRRHGKVMFLDLKDELHKLQIYIRKEEIGENEFEICKLMDIGDIAGVKGILFVTKTGELTVQSNTVELLSKSLKPLPEKFHGLKDIESRYRKRHIDLIMSDEVKKVFFKRAYIIDTIRNVLKDKGFLEVETPILQPVYGGAFAEPFTTHHNTHDMNLYLRIANELYLKRLLIGGINRVFEFAKDFRNEGIDKTHNPEFTQVEFYQSYADYNDMMELVEEIFEKLTGGEKIIYQNDEIDFKRPWARIDFYDSIKEKTGHDLKGKNTEELKGIAKELNIDVENKKTFGKIIDEIFSQTVQKKLINPTFVMNHPFEVSPLAKKHREKDNVVERFEPIIAGLEVGNAFSELNDPLDQLERFNKQMEEREKGDKEAFKMDEDFLDAMMSGMPPAGGVGLGIDRIVMILTNMPSIRDVILFPLLKKEK